MALEIGQRVGEYEILSLLGAGGMGQVYSVRNVISGRLEAMKILLPDFGAEAELASRFTVEIRTLATFDHPNIAQLRTAFQFENQLVMIMEYVEGTTLEKLPGARPILLSDALSYSNQVLAALTYAHSKGVTHRDIKPANIMVTSHGVAKLMDFGIAKSSTDPQLTRPGTTVGSVYYMSPEQVRGGNVDARSDIYSFGVTLYEMLTGRRPFQGENAYNVLSAQLNESPVPPGQLNPSVPAGFNEVVLRAMSKTPEGRYQSAEEFRQALLKAQQGSESTASVTVPIAVQPIASPTASPTAIPSAIPPPPAKPPAKNQRGLWLGLGAAAAIIAMIAAITLLPRMLATHASQETAASVTEPKVPAQSSGSGNGAATSLTAAASSSTPNPPTVSPSKGTPSQSAIPARPTAPVSTAHPQPTQEPSQMKPAPEPADSLPAGPSN